jgi:hypothetical protein
MTDIPNDEEVLKSMTAYADEAVEFAAKAMDSDLDFSIESLEKVEDILDVLSSEIPKSRIMRLLGKGPEPGEIVEMSKIWGAYIGEVFRRKWDGTWTVNTKILKNDWLYALSIRDNQMFPPAKVFKRLKNGKEDNILTYFQAFVEIMGEE